MKLPTDPPDLTIIAVSFPAEDVIQIQYAEEREQSSVAAIQRSMMVDVEQIPDEVADLIEAAREIVDKGLMLIRNPPKRRAARGQDVVLDEDDE